MLKIIYCPPLHLLPSCKVLESGNKLKRGPHVDKVATQNVLCGGPDMARVVAAENVASKGPSESGRKLIRGPRVAKVAA